MKLLFSLALLFLLSFTSDKIDSNTNIDHIFKSKSFNISIEKLDFGYLQNKEIFYFDVYPNTILATHRSAISNGEKEKLNNTPITQTALDSIKVYCKLLLNFETNQKKAHDKIFNSKDIHDFMYIKNDSTTVLISDAKGESVQTIFNIINHNLK